MESEACKRQPRVTGQPGRSRKGPFLFQNPLFFSHLASFSKTFFCGWLLTVAWGVVCGPVLTGPGSRSAIAVREGGPKASSGIVRCCVRPVRGLGSGDMSLLGHERWLEVQARP